VSFRKLAINGKFLTAELTGVHRVAEQLVSQLACHRGELMELFDQPPKLVAPTNLANSVRRAFEIERKGMFRGQLWEQVDLLNLTRQDLLLNLCNLGPMASRAAITMIHDAQVFITPGSYSRGFANWYRRVLPILGRRHARILAVSEFSALELARYGVAKKEHISVIPNGVDHVLAYQSEPSILRRLNLSSKRFVVGLANVQIHKNIGVLLKAFSTSALTDQTLVLVGSANRRQFEKLGHAVPANVVFAGTVSDGELRALLEQALCIGFPSTTEGFGLPPLEGMILGCPAIVAPCGALSEVAGNAAMFASPYDPSQWVSAIRKLVEDRNCWHNYSCSGKERAYQFTWKNAGNKLFKVIEDVAIAKSFAK
jgi:glycosyltransferase involved in cell wall biosynthesis